MVVAVAEQGTTLAAPRAAVRTRIARIIGLVAVADALIIIASVVAALALKFGFAVWPPPQVDWFAGTPWVDFGWLVPVWVVSLAFHDAYSRRQFARGSDEYKTVLKGSVTAALVTTSVAYLVNYDMSRGFFVYAFSLGTALLLAERWLVRRVVVRLRAGGELMHRVVVVGGGPAVAELERVLTRNTGLGYQIVGDCGLEQDPAIACRNLDADTLIVVGSFAGTSADLRRIGWDLDGTDIDLIVVPSLIDVAGPRIHTRPVAGLPLMHIEPPQVDRAMKWGKAVFDRVGATLLLIVLSPLLLGVAIAVKVESTGPIFYRHRRIGVRGQEFGVWKFRSMVVDADRHFTDLVEASDSSVLLFKVKDDPRLTRVGAFIRRYSLDELPQLFNVLVGQMSLVGPRPQVAAEVEAYDDSAHRRLLVRPGITGLWQVSGRSNLTWDEAVRLDLFYVDNWSMAGDLAILARTLRAVLSQNGAL